MQQELLLEGGYKVIFYNKDTEHNVSSKNSVAYVWHYELSRDGLVYEIGGPFHQKSYAVNDVFNFIKDLEAERTCLTYTAAVSENREICMLEVWDYDEYLENPLIYTEVMPSYNDSKNADDLIKLNSKLHNRFMVWYTKEFLRESTGS